MADVATARVACVVRRSVQAVTAGRYCPTNHRNFVEDGWRVEKSRDREGKLIRHAWVLSTCTDCGQRLEEPYKLKRTGDRRPIPVAQDREAS